MNNIIKTTFNGKVLPAIGETVYIVRRAKKANKVGRIYTANHSTEVELVKGEVCSLSYGMETRRHNGAYIDITVWSGEAAVLPNDENDIVCGMVKFNPYTSSQDESEARKLLAFYGEHGLVGDADLTMTGDCEAVTDEVLAKVLAPAISDLEDTEDNGSTPKRSELKAKEVEKCTSYVVSVIYERESQLAVPCATFEIACKKANELLKNYIIAEGFLDGDEFAEGINEGDMWEKATCFDHRCYVKCRENFVTKGKREVESVNNKIHPY
jgi:hypothetical protein